MGPSYIVVQVGLDKGLIIDGLNWGFDSVESSLGATGAM